MSFAQRNRRPGTSVRHFAGLILCLVFCLSCQARPVPTPQPTAHAPKAPAGDSKASADAIAPASTPSPSPLPPATPGPGATATGSTELLPADPRLLLPPPGRVLSGARLPQSPEASTDALQSFAAASGKMPVLQLVSYGWSDATWANVRKQLDVSDPLGITLMVSWEPGIAGPKPPLQAITDGDQDSIIRAFAHGAKEFGKPIFLRWGPEMNGNWYPWSGWASGKRAQQYVQAWRHVHDLMAQEEGARNVIWVWCPNAYSVPNEPWNSLAAYYPGDEYVDWVAMDFYGLLKDWGRVDPGPALDTVYTLYGSRKPVMIGESAAADPDHSDPAFAMNKPDWIKAWFDAIEARPNVRGFIWENTNQQADWRVDSDAASLAAYSARLRDDRYLAAGDQRSAIGPLPAGASLLAPLAGEAGQPEMATITPITAPLQVTVDAQWPAGVPLSLGETSARGGDPNVHGLSAVVALFWDADALYLEARVQDPSPLINDRQDDRIREGDGLEIAMGTHPAANPVRGAFGAGDYLVGLAAAPTPSGWNWSAHAPLQDLAAVTSLTPGGYLLRSRIPWSNFGGFQPQASQVLAFDLALNDAATGDAGRQAQLIWHGDASFVSNPGAWGQAILGGSLPGRPTAGRTAEAFLLRAGAIRVDTSHPITPVSTLAFGTNVGPWQNLNSNQQSLAQAAGFGILRFPGGDWGEDRPWGRAELDAFMVQARTLNADPLVNVRLLNSSPEEAALLVNHALNKSYHIRYWAIGNEPSLYVPNRGVPGYNVARYNQAWRASAQAMKAADPSILLVGPEIDQYSGSADDPRDDQNVDWMEGFLKANGDLVDIVSFHRYPFGRQAATPLTLLANPAEWDHTIPYLRQRIKAITGRDLPIAVTEINSDWTGIQDGPATPDSVLNALWWADVQGRLLRQGVQIVNQFALEGAAGLGMLAAQPRPIYYVFSLYSHFGTTMLETRAPDDLPAYAALASDGALTLLVINRSEASQTLPVTLEGFQSKGLAEGWLLDATHQAQAFLSPEPAVNSFVYTFPPRSVTLLRVPGAKQ